LHTSLGQRRDVFVVGRLDEVVRLTEQLELLEEVEVHEISTPYLFARQLDRITHRGQHTC